MDSKSVDLVMNSPPESPLSPIEKDGTLFTNRFDCGSVATDVASYDATKRRIRHAVFSKGETIKVDVTDITGKYSNCEDLSNAQVCWPIDSASANDDADGRYSALAFKDPKSLQEHFYISPKPQTRIM
jgi:predicted lipoprotein with Yx(FWY)xxD motif